ncbi:MAG: hypothetical protein KAJ60_04735 [Desulfobulbaceae bacterium]|nr:hypothetical protein [Desulfobulbaceae bacterium]MCK5403909.1 hypothetical protein [Desulfobulbaceae bacterium]
MPVWPYRYQISLKHRLRRSVYEVFRDQLDGYLFTHALINSYKNFVSAGEPYPFVQKRELKPRARITEQEYINQNHFLVLFCEGTIPNHYKKYIRFFDHNKVTKDAINELIHIQLHKKYTKNLRHFDNPDFSKLMLDLTPVDYALLIQQDPSIKRQNRYVMTHFHVRVDWPIDDATEEMAQQLRYISKELYERGEKYAQHLHHKLFENYGYHHSSGGRRTAAVVASQFLKKMDFISTVYVASSESRTLARISERGVSKYVLVKLPIVDIFQLAEENHISFDKFAECFLIDFNDDYGVGILQVVYSNTMSSKPPEDGKLRKLRPDYQWLTVSDQLLLPIIDCQDTYPIPYSTVYTSD